VLTYSFPRFAGGTVDVTVQKVLPDGKLKELHKASGGAWGGTKVDESFLQMLLQLVGEPVMKRLKEEFTSYDLELAREFESKKRTIDGSLQSRVTLRIPIALSELFEEEYGENLKDSVKQTSFAGKITWTGDKARIDPEVIKGLFELCSKSVVDHVKDLLKMEACQEVNTILMVGGFSECSIIQEAVKSSFSHMRVIIPEDAGLAVVKGAVLFGHDPQTVVSRKAKYTYGVKISRDFRQGDPTNKRFEHNGRSKCSSVFSKHVTVNDTVVVGEALEPQHYYPLYKNSKEVSVPIFISTDDDPDYTTQSCCSFLGNIKVPLSPGSSDNTDIEVKMTFGGTEMTVEACESQSGKSLSASFDFLDH